MDNLFFPRQTRCDMTLLHYNMLNYILYIERRKSIFLLFSINMFKCVHY